MLGVAALLLIGSTAFDLRLEYNLFSLFVGVLLGLTVKFWRAPLPFAAIIAFLFVASHYFNVNTSDLLVRNFFGVLNVTESSDGRFRVLWHGTTEQVPSAFAMTTETPYPAGRK